MTRQNANTVLHGSQAVRLKWGSVQRPLEVGPSEDSSRAWNRIWRKRKRVSGGMGDNGFRAEAPVGHGYVVLPSGFTPLCIDS